MGTRGAIWSEMLVEAEPARRAWPRKSSGDGSLLSSPQLGVVQAAQSTGAQAAQSIGTQAAQSSVAVAPATAMSDSEDDSDRGAAGEEAAPIVQHGSALTLQQKRGMVVFRSCAQWQEYRNCDLLIQLGNTQKRLFMNLPDKDGRDPRVQEQVLAEVQMQQTKRNAKNLIRRHLSERKNQTLRVGVESLAGRHRSVAMVEELANECAEFAFVSKMHMCVHRWDPTYTKCEPDDGPEPKNQMVIRPETRNAA